MRAIINIDVPALAPAIEFYCAALPLRHSRGLDDDVAELRGASCLIYLLQKDEQSPSSAGVGSETRHYVRHWTPVHLDFVVEDLEAAVARAEQAGAVRESAVVDWRGSRCLTFSDPFGHGFCLIQFEGEGYRD